MVTFEIFLSPPPHGRLAAWRARPPRPASVRRGSAPEQRRPSAAAERRTTDLLTHDVNNLLAVIVAASETLALSLPAGSYSHELAQVSQDAAERAAAMLAQAAGRQGLSPLPMETCDAAAAIRVVARLAQMSGADAIRIQCDIGDGDLACGTDRRGLESALLNVCLNACHAMPKGGVLTLSADICGADVLLRVSDTGCGMSPGTLARATERGFTTRRSDGGTGLGLTGVAEFARRHGGRLALASRKGRGTTVTLRLPRVADGAVALRL